MARLKFRDHSLARPPFRLPRVSLRLLLPNLVTLLAVCAGLTAIRLAIEGQLENALIAILFACVLDGMDGRLARFLKGTSRFGAELDSLADFVNFGVAPGLILYIAFLRDYHSLGWIAALIFAIASALRLARFNVEEDRNNKPEWQALFFAGVPAPAGAVCALLPLYLEHAGVERHLIPSILVLLYIVSIAFLMISRVPTFSGKMMQFYVKREYVALMIIGLTAFISLLVAYTFEMLIALTFLYLASLPFSWRAYQKLKASKILSAPGMAENETTGIEIEQ